jgi:hypothetical protein
VGAPAAARGGNDVVLLAQEDVAQRFPIEPGSSDTFGGKRATRRSRSFARSRDNFFLSLSETRFSRSSYFKSRNVRYREAHALTDISNVALLSCRAW